MVLILVLILILLAAPAGVVAQPVTVSITGGLYMPDGTAITASTTAPVTIHARLSSPIQVGAADGSDDLVWVGQLRQTITITDATAPIISLAPNMCDGCTVQPTSTYYDIRITYSGGSFDQTWSVTCTGYPDCADLPVGEAVVIVP